MISFLLEYWRGRRGRQNSIEVGNNININRSLPTSPTFPTSYNALAYVGKIFYVYIIFLKHYNFVVVNEVGEVGEVGVNLLLSVSSLPLPKWRGRLPTSSYLLEASS